MNSKRRPQSFHAEINYFEGLIKCLTKRNIYDAKGVLLLCKSLFPNNSRVKILEYELLKATNNLKQAANVLADIVNSDDPFSASEISQIFSGLNTVPMDPTCQQIFMALPHRVQYDALTKYTWSSSSVTLSQADFLLDFLKKKTGPLDANHLAASLIGVLMDLLLTAESEHHDSCANTSVHLPIRSKTVVEKSAKISSPPVRKTVKSPTLRDLSEEGEEGEVLEEGEEECEDLEEDDEEEFENRRDSIKKNTQNVHDVMNIFRMKLACDVLPMAYQLRQTIKIGIPQLEKLFVKSFQFLLTYSAKLPFTGSQRFPKISGLSESLPDILLQEPSKYLRLYLDMASDMLNWPVADSFQVQSREDLFKRLRECVSFYITAEHEATLIHQKSRKRNQRGVVPTIDSSVTAISCQTVCLYWSLFIETAVEYVKKCVPHDSSISSLILPVNLTKILEPIVLTHRSPRNDDSYESLLCSIQELHSIRLNCIAPLFSQSNRGSRRNRDIESSVIQMIDISVRPQDFNIHMLIALRNCQIPKSILQSCELERLLRLHLMLLFRCDDIASELLWADECIKTALTLSNEDSSILPYSKRQLMCLKSIVGAIFFARQLHKTVLDQTSWLKDMIDLHEFIGDEDESLSSINSILSFCSMDVYLLDLSSSLNSLQLCQAVIEIRFISQFTRSLDIQLNLNEALLIMILHQNGLWKHILSSSADRKSLFSNIFKILRTNWSLARPKIVQWLKNEFIVDVDLLAQIAQIETEKSEKNADTEMLNDCLRYIKQPSTLLVVSVLARFIKSEFTLIHSCLIF